MDDERRREASFFVGYTMNTQNTATDYRSGDEFHADFALAQYLPGGFVTGMAGYALQQTTPDYGGGAVFGSFRGRVLALGPLMGKTVGALEASDQFYRQVRRRVRGAKSIDRQRIVAHRRSAVLMAIEQAEKFPASSHGQVLCDITQEFRLNLELLPEAAMIYALDGTILSVNSIVARIFETDASEIIGKNLFSMGAVKAEEARAADARRGDPLRNRLFVAQRETAPA